MFNIGDNVTVVSIGGCYSYYEKWATLHLLQGFRKYWHPPNGSEGIIIARGFHGDSDDILYGIQFDNGTAIFIGTGIRTRVEPKPGQVWQSKQSKDTWLILSDGLMQYIYNGHYFVTRGLVQNICVDGLEKIADLSEVLTAHIE